MYGSPSRRGSRLTRAYATIDLDTRVMSASPSQLITMLFEGAQTAMAKAQAHLQNDEPALRGQAISKAIDIVDSGLKAGLDMDTGGELAQNLSQTYDLIVQQLLLANLNADPEPLTLAQTMLANLYDGWQQNLSNLAAPPQPA